MLNSATSWSRHSSPTKFPIEFRHIQTADLTSWTPGEPNPEFEKLLAGLHQLLDGLKKPEISEGDKPTQTMVGEVEEQIPAGLPAQKKTGKEPKPGRFRSWRTPRSALRWAGMTGVALAYNGSGAYDSMFRDLLAQKIQGILLDKPYALQQIGAFGKDHPTANFVMADVDDKIFANVQAEQIGWAVRSFDRPLLNEINKQLQQQEHSRTELIKKFFPNPEAFLPE